MNYEICPISGETFKEEFVNYLTHFIGLILSLIGLPVLIIYSHMYGDGWTVVSYAIYGTTLVLLYVASTFYHGCQTLHRKTKFRVIDHACIYLLIAGSYTPFTLGPLRETSGWMLLTLEWGIAAIGILFKVFVFNRFQMVSLIAYLVMGWLVIFSWSTLMEKLSPTTIVLVALGGLSYTCGTIFFLWEKLPFNHAIWHVFVLGGSGCHFGAILMLV